MTFDLDHATRQARDRARDVAAAARPHAAAIDATGVVPDAVRRQARESLASPADRLAWAVALEELAAVSGGLAVDAAWPAVATGAPEPWAGLRGAATPPATVAAAGAAGVLGVAAVLVGLGRAALETALVRLRALRAAGGTPEFEHWGIADAATELDAARLLVWQAAAALDGTSAAMARLQARVAADAAVAIARRVAGADGAAAGGELDRLSRDVVTASLVFGGAEADEAAVASGVLPG
ncbi:MAG: acyl-CoA dehydrogenase family protein [Vicinamibacterales bacterium]